MPWKAEGAAGGGSEQDRGREHGARWGYGSTRRGAPSVPGASCNVRRAGGRGEEEVTWRESGQLGCGVRVESAGSPLAST